MPAPSDQFALSLRHRLLFSHILTTLVGVMVVALSSRLFDYNWRDEFVVALFGLLSILIVSILSSRTIIQPLQRMAKAVNALAQGDLSVRIARIAIPELNTLGRQFNHMAESLQMVEQRRRQLTSDMAHELRSPITVIHGYLEMMKAGMAQFSPEILAQMQQESVRLIRLIDDLLELSRVESGRLLLRWESVDITRLFQTLKSELANPGSPVHCQIDIIVPPNPPLVYADPDRLKQILVNLMSNAMTYTPNGVVVLRAWVQADQVWIAVEDNGIGIAAEDIPYIFERFWRADPSRDSHTGGSGIGLAIVKQLLELHGSQIEVESALNQGSRFGFALPASRSGFPPSYIRESQITDR